MRSNVRRGPGANRRQRQARKELERLFQTITTKPVEPIATVEVIYRKRRVIPTVEG